RVVERGLDLVEEVERARLREEEGEEERDRTERLLPAREQRQAGDLLSRGAQLHLDAGLRAGTVLVVRLDEPQPALAAREERRGDLLEVGRNRGERLVEAPVHGLRQLVAERGELGERRLEIRTLGRELVEPLLLGLVLLLGERIDLPERLATRFEPGHARGELVAVDGVVVVVRRLGLGRARVRRGGQRLVETTSRLPRL